jgi:uncharacterized protein YcbK (DUF882 family)
MSLPRLTVMVLVPGRKTVCLELDYRIPSAFMAVLLATTMVSATMARCLGPNAGDARCGVHAQELTGSLGSLAWPEPPSGRSFVAVSTRSALARALRHQPTVASVRPQAPAPLATMNPHTTSLAPIDGAPDVAGLALRLNAVHLGESVDLKPFDASGAPSPTAFAELQHLMRCRISGEEIPIDPRLIRVLAQLNAYYHRPIQLVSGHRKPYVIGTKPTSQHALGRAADIRIPGVGIEELRETAIRLGARGVGLYPEKGFVHVDVRAKAKYFWNYTEALGEQPDLRLIGAVAGADRHASGE